MSLPQDGVNGFVSTVAMQGLLSGVFGCLVLAQLLAVSICFSWIPHLETGSRFSILMNTLMKTGIR